MTDVVDYEADILRLRKGIEDHEGQAVSKRAAADQLVADMRSSGTDPLEDTDAFERADAAYKDADQHAEQASQLRQKLDKLYGWVGRAQDKTKPREPGQRARREDTLGGRLTSSDAYGALIRSGKATNRDAHFTSDAAEVMSRDELMDYLRLRTTIDLTTGGALVAPDFQLFPPIEKPIRRVLLVDLVDQTTTESDVVEWVLQTVRSNTAVETAVGAPAPEEDFEFVLQTSNVQDITSFVPAGRNILRDQSQLEDLVNSQLMASAMLRLERQILRGDGTGQNLKGILNTSGIATVTTRDGSHTTEYDLDAVHRGITQVRLGLFDDPDGVGLHPTDEETIVLQKASGTGAYIFDPGSESQTIWGLQKSVSTVFTQGTGLVGNFKRGARLWTREGVNVMASTEHADFFIRRLVAILGLMRVAFAVVQPAAFSQVTGL